jgi:hypothetical protein
VVKPGKAGPPHDLEQPALGIAVAIGIEIAKSPQIGFLHDIGSVGIATRHPSRERVGGVEMGQRHRLKPAAVKAIRVPRHAPKREFLRFRRRIDRGCGPVETKGTPKAEPSFRTDLCVGPDIVRRFEGLSI